MEFEFKTYQISEDMTPVQPMLVISRPLTVDVMVQVDTENLSAIGMFAVHQICCDSGKNFIITTYVIIMIVTLL